MTDAWQPMLATMGSVEALGPDEGQWHFEVKWDGYRALVHQTSDHSLRLRSRGGLDLAPSYPELREVQELLQGQDVVLDGEIVALTADGRSDFELLQNHGRAGSSGAHLMLFDLLHLDGHDLLRMPYLQRRELLLALVGRGTAHAHVPETFGPERELALTASGQLRLEGLVAKRVGSTYQPGRRSEDWVKIKIVFTQEVVVVGWSRGSGNRSHGLGSVLLAVPDESGVLHCVGSAGSGFSVAAQQEARERLALCEVDHNPGVVGVRPAESRGLTWVRPGLAAEVSHSMWTAAGRLRHPVWRGWRDDLDPMNIVRGEG